MRNVKEDFFVPENRKYISKMMAYPLLSKKEEQALAKSWAEKKDQKSLHQLIKSYGRLVIKIASNYKGYNLPLEDLIQEGNIGLIEAANRFDVSRDVRFSTYAIWWITACIQEFVLKNSSVVRLGTSAKYKSLFFNLRRVKNQILKNGDGIMGIDEINKIAEILNVSPKEVEKMDAYLNAPDQSLNANVSEDYADELQNMLSNDNDDMENTPAAVFDYLKVQKEIQIALSDLDERERKVIEQRFLNDEKITLSEIGKGYGVTKERIRQIESLALKKLQSILSSTFDKPLDLLDAIIA